MGFEVETYRDKALAATRIMVEWLLGFTFKAHRAMKRRLRILLLLCILVASVLLIRHVYSLPWTGFGPSVDSKGNPVPAKTLWDWLDLLIVPMFLAFGVWFLDGSRKASEARVEADRQRQKTLEDYFQCMTALLLEGKLTEDDACWPARDIARTRTLAALRALDGGRKAQLLQFLYESGLVGANPIVQLNGANLNAAELDEAVLRKAELRGVYFQRASFRNATLADADLRGSDFSGADFTGANLEGANLIQARLKNVTLIRAQLDRAIVDRPTGPAQR